ncbi:hypothetical protein BJV85_003620 [Clostridium acetobutylicum]|nr:MULTISPECIES: hypothetical protein [Clostridium]ADZ19448.1 conserved hypothetical protein [Clostridium acetobutylicum EA 2018]NOV89195.1 hypothetical protein [Clostridium acetobutylicum]NOW16272.1 hypothetical protein [Clostridium acetobutylicum]NRY57954.1 hypothetical protein [Clostridium acetobutylicum]NSA94697.1 hypothetical protein [Clostridium acetobutylicum]
MKANDDIKLTIRDLDLLSKKFSSISNDFYEDKAMVNTQLKLLESNNSGLNSTDIIYNDISKVMKDFDSIVHKLSQMSKDLEVAEKEYKDADNSFERKVNEVLHTAINEVEDFGEDIWEKYKKTPGEGAAFLSAAFNSAKDMTLGAFDLMMYGLYMKANPVAHGKELYREAGEVYKCIKNPKKIMDNLGPLGKAFLGINDKEIKNAAIHGDSYTIKKNMYAVSINALLIGDTGAGLLGKASKVEKNINKAGKLESAGKKFSVFSKDIPNIEDKLASFREFLANKLRGVTREIPNPQLVRDSMGNTYMVWAKKGGSSGGEVLKNEKVVNGVAETGGKLLSVEEYLKREVEAEKMYDIIRNYTTDVKKISENTGIPESRINRIKEHVFYNEHIKTYEVGRFDPNYDMANAWERLIKGNYVQSDIDLLNHEIFESKFESIFKTDYSTAHSKTESTGRIWNP